MSTYLKTVLTYMCIGNSGTANVGWMQAKAYTSPFILCWLGACIGLHCTTGMFVYVRSSLVSRDCFCASVFVWLDACVLVSCGCQIRFVWLDACLLVRGGCQLRFVWLDACMLVREGCTVDHEGQKSWKGKEVRIHCIDFVACRIRWCGVAANPDCPESARVRVEGWKRCCIASGMCCDAMHTCCHCMYPSLTGNRLPAGDGGRCLGGLLLRCEKPTERMCLSIRLSLELGR